MKETRKPKILVVDIETRPAIAYVWRMFKENIPNERLIESDGILCIGVKWVGEKKTEILSVWEHGHRGMLSRFLELVGEADGMITYNGTKFDLPHITTALIKENLPPPAPVSHIDLFQFIRNKTKFMSKKLGFVGPELGLGEKMKHSGFDLWVKVMQGDKKAQKEMAQYCREDVELTERLYEYLKGYITNHPNFGFIGAETCPACGSHKTQRRGFYYTAQYYWQRHQCTSCGKWFKSHQRKIKKDGS